MLTDATSPRPLRLKLGGAERELVIDMNTAALYQEQTGKSIIETVMEWMDSLKPIQQMAAIVGNPDEAATAEDRDSKGAETARRIGAAQLNIRATDLRALVWAAIASGLPESEEPPTLRKVGSWLTLQNQLIVAPEIAAYAVRTFASGTDAEEKIENPPAAQVNGSAAALSSPS